LSNFTIIELDIVDSTNNYAMLLIDADKAQYGMTIVANSQTGGKGQRGKTWVDTPGQSLLMTVITDPSRPITDQFVFNSSVAVTIANVLQQLCSNWTIHIKWPNDIIINDKKAGGILIENILRGNKWTHCVIGLGLNVSHEEFPAELPFATSLKMASGTDFKMAVLRDSLAENIVAATSRHLPGVAIMNEYNKYLYRKGQKQSFNDGNGDWDATILKAKDDGTLELQLEDGTIHSYRHGQVLWNWR
jgi:BirA family transcriptional regulator, biotin operon repressor / biotin---[acetyl-CoA-carboxylase] ligase